MWTESEPADRQQARSDRPGEDRRFDDASDRFHPEPPGAWRAWLAKNHTRATGMWFDSCKQHTGRPIAPDDLAEAFALLSGAQAHGESFPAIGAARSLGVDRAGEAARDPGEPRARDRRACGEERACQPVAVSWSRWAS